MSASTPNAFLNIDDAHLRVTSGNVYAQGLNISGISFSGVSGLQTVTNTGNVTTNTLEFKNGERAFVATSNVDVKGSLDVANVATIYNGSNADYDQKQKFTSTVSASGNYFSNTLAVSTNGLYAIVGAHGEDKAYTFTRSGSTWTQENIFSSTTGSAFGYAVDISSDGTYAIVGGNGSASVFYRSSGSTWDSGTTLTAGGISVTTGYGASVSISDDGSYAIVGATGQNAAYIFRRTGTTTWDAGVKIALTGFTLGFSVAISGDGLYALLGAHAQHTAYVFKRTGAYIWSQQVKITENDSFGYSVALSTDGSRALIGATGGNGKAYSYERSGSDWSQNAIITASDAASGDAFGSAVSLSSDGSYALIGAPGNEKAYTFKNAGTVWTELGIETASDATAGHVFGRSVSISGDGIYALVGASGNEAAYSYERKETLVLDVRGEANVRTLNVSDDLTSNNLTVTRNLNITTIRSDSNVVAEYTGPHDRPLRKYPEVAMATGQGDGYTQDGYTVEESSDYGAASHKLSNAFDHKTASISASDSWLSGQNTYAGDGTALNASSPDIFQDIKGSWIGIRLPKKIKLSHIHLYNFDFGTTSNRPPKTGIVWASNNSGSSWNRINDFSCANQARNGLNAVNVNSTRYYDWYRVQITEMVIDGSYTNAVSLQEVEFYGYEEGDASLDTTLKTMYNVPATTGTQLEVYYDAKDLDNAALTSVSGLGGTTIGGIAYGNPQISDGAFVFDGTGDAIQTAATSLTGNAIFTASLWVKLDRVTDSTSQNVIFTIGYDGTRTQSGLRVNEGTGKFRFYTYGGTGSLTTEVTAVTNTWYHLNLVHNGSSGYQLYINGEMIGESFTDDLNLASNSTVGLGAAFASSGTINSSTLPFKGSIANFRLYSKVLNAGQVQELYDYQKDFFLGSKSQLTLYKGHLGVGVTEPSGQLELAGDERIQEYPPRDLYQYDTNIEGHGVFCVSASNEYDSNHPAWEAFGDNATSTSNESVWNTPGSLYNTTSGLYTGSTTTSGIKGEWIQMKTPYKLKISTLYLDSYLTSASGRQPRNFTLLGSNDGNVWEQMKSVVNQTTGYTMGHPYNTSTGGPTHTINSTKYYSYFRIVVTATQDNTKSGTLPDGLAAIGRIKFFGTPGPTTLDKGSLSLTRNLDVPRVSRYDVDTETPRPEKLDVEFDTTVNSSPIDISGKGNHGTFNGASYVAEDKAFLFDGSTDRIDATHTLGTGNLVFSESVWVNFDSPLAGSSGSSGKFVGLGSINGSTYNGHMLSVDGNGKVFVDNYSSFCNTPSGTIEANRWYHIVYARTAGSANSPTNNHIYVDGVKIDMSGTQSANQGDLNIQDGAGGSTDAYKANYLHVGGNVNGYFKGKISNYKLYSVCLEPSEVRKLYRLGRTGRSMVISDTAVGIGKAPEAQLDIRGNLKLNGLVMPHIIAGHWTMTGADPSVVQIMVNESNCVTSIANGSGAGYGENMSGNRGRFTAPVTGLYHFSTSCTQATRSTSGYLGTMTQSGGAIQSSWPFTYAEIFDFRSSDNEEQSYSFSKICKMDAGDNITIQTYGPGYTDNNVVIHGSVHLVYAIPSAAW